MGWVIHLDHYQQKAKEAQTSDNSEVVELGKLLEHAVSNVADDREQRARLFKLLELAPDDVERMEATLAQHYGEPVRRISRYCGAFDDWLAKALPEAWAAYDALPEDERAYRTPPPLYEIREQVPSLRSLAVGKSNYLARRIYGGEEHRTEKCPLHQGHWSGYAGPGEECPHGCSLGAYDVTGWLPAES